MNARIRLATVKDLGRIQEIYRPYVEDTVLNSEHRVPTMDELLERFELVTEDFPWVVCEIDGEVAAYAYASRPFKREGYKWNAELSVYTDSKYHGRRLASALYECILEILVLQGYYNVYACVLSVNEKSMKFHEKYGFKVIGTFPNIVNKHNQWIDLMWMGKSLQTYINNPEPPVSICDIDKEKLEDVFKKNKGVIKGI
ncbi:MAG: N-acetyltransferase family protein [Terrisporobacter sp.]|uniref:GNAT family N-acetyltransferase n=1 Tax=Terrisporobacter sp. TaxID=1965305 RepID=UPI002FCB65EB